ncbi:MAG: apolipoprotein N-acyltransferase [Chitinivibrionales bacterium]|nr:apolipoprotein N-acyltransferase [Chitinivibrionales bacterium]MBD3396038.1 apolipoprotein N-acyltransferase [Chitinivibrionales bacterium]
MKELVARFVSWYGRGQRWWVPLILGVVYPLAFPPVNHQSHLLLAPFPLLGLIILVPVFSLAMQPSFKRAAFHTYLFGVAASFGQYYWVAGVAAEGMRHLLVLGSVLMSMFLALYLAVPGLLFRLVCMRFKRTYIIIFPCLWVLFEFFRGWGELSFPWNYLGYVFVPLLPLAQLASIAGVFGLSFVAVLGNILVWEVARSYYRKKDIIQKWLHLVVFAAALGIAAIWGSVRLGGEPAGRYPPVTVSLLQTNMDQAHWGSGSLDTCMDITGAMVYQAARDKPDLLVMPESALFCYMARRPWARKRVMAWSDSAGVPMILGSLHWERDSINQLRPDYRVYNTAFFLDTGTTSFRSYFKIRLLPFSEVMPFEAQVPLLNRVNLGEADFTRGTEETVFSLHKDIRAAPFICFEIVFPEFVRRRVRAGANLLVNITNDGWWGRSSGPYHHAAQARLRCIENGVPMVRCANSGISMFVDQWGRVLSKTELGTRTILTRDLNLSRVSTLYTRAGEWILLAALFIAVAALLYVIVQAAIARWRQTNRSLVSDSQASG